MSWEKKSEAEENQLKSTLKSKGSKMKSSHHSHPESKGLLEDVKQEMPLESPNLNDFKIGFEDEKKEEEESD